MLAVRAIFAALGVTREAQRRQRNQRHMWDENRHEGNVSEFYDDSQSKTPAGKCFTPLQAEALKPD